MNNNYFQIQINLLFLLISIILCFNLVVTRGEIQDSPGEQESEEFQNALVRNVRDDYRNGFVEFVNFINSINDTLAVLNTKFATLTATIDAQNSKFKALDEKLDGLTTKANKAITIETLNETFTAQDTVLNTNVGKLLLLGRASFLNTVYNYDKWKVIDIIIRTQPKEIKTGKSFNGSTLSDIKSRASRVGYKGQHTAVVFVNHLDEAIGNSDHKYITPHHPEPNSIPGRTQEAFILRVPSGYRGAWSSFSYEIPSFNIRVAAISEAGTAGVGLAFVRKEADMKTYFETHNGIKGSTAWESGDHVDRNLSVGYKNLYARMIADYEGNYQSTLRIELIKLILDD